MSWMHHPLWQAAWFTGACLLLVVPAYAVMPPDTYREARREADHHVQVEVTRVATPWRTPGTCTVKGRVVTVFRSKAGRLAAGTPVSFSIDCLKAGDQPPLGGTLWGSVDELTHARFIEVYLNGIAPPRMAVARWQYRVIDAPTAEPTCPADRHSLTCW